jgi:hypothetical protein
VHRPLLHKETRTPGNEQKKKKKKKEHTRKQHPSSEITSSDAATLFVRCHATARPLDTQPCKPQRIQYKKPC